MVEGWKQHLKWTFYAYLLLVWREIFARIIKRTRFSKIFNAISIVNFQLVSQTRYLTQFQPNFWSLISLCTFGLCVWSNSCKIPNFGNIIKNASTRSSNVYESTYNSNAIFFNTNLYYIWIPLSRLVKSQRFL